jgi:regulator of protease activity HflC (stomatin/prohibitin superfamily)
MKSSMNRYGRAGALIFFAVSFLGAGLLVLFLLMMVHIGPDERGVVIKHQGPPLRDGALIALNGEAGPQADVLQPGWHFFARIPFIRSVEKHALTTIPNGRLLTLVAMDGKPLPADMTYAPEWDSLMWLDARAFLTGGGFRGPQLTVIPPSRVFVHPYLFQHNLENALSVAAGEAVAIRDLGGPVSPTEVANVNGNAIVPRGFRGIWVEPIQAGLWYIHPIARQPIRVATTERTFTYQQGVDNKGRPYDEAISIRTRDGFPASVDVRINLVVRPESVPYLAALLGDPDRVEFSLQEQDELSRIEHTIILPEVRSAVRNVAEGVDALRLVNDRSAFESRISELIRPGLEGRHITLNFARVGAIDLTRTEAGQKLVQTQTDKRVAEEQIATFRQQQQAEEQRLNLVRAQTAAEQESQIVISELAIVINESRARAMVAQARGEAEATIERAKGDAEAYRLRSEIIGPEALARLEMIRLAGEGKVTITPQVVSGEQGVGILLNR